MRRLAITLLLSIIAACGGPDAPQTTNYTTIGFAFDSVGAVKEVNYTAYCTRSPDVNKETAIVVSLGTATTVYWSSIPFPDDGNWYCAAAAKTSDADESPLSSVIGVTKVGSNYYRL